MLVAELKRHVKNLSPVLRGPSPIVHLAPECIWAGDDRATIEIESHLAVQAALPARALRAALDGHDAKSDVALATRGTDLIVRADGSETRVCGVEHHDKPAHATAQVVAAAKAPPDFGDRLEAVGTAALRDEARPVLTGVWLELAGNVSLTATDSYRLHHDELQAECSGTGSALLPTGFGRVLGGDSPCLIELTSGHVRILQGAVSLTLRCIEGEFPAYRSLMPPSFSCNVALGRGTLGRLTTLKRLAARLANPSPVILSLGSDGVEAVIQLPEVGHHRTRLPLERWEGEPQRIALNPRFLHDALAFGGHEVRVTDALKPVMVTGASPARYALVMPVRIS